MAAVKQRKKKISETNKRAKKNKLSISSERITTQLSIPDTLPVLPAKDIVAFPSVMMSLHVGRPSSIKAVEAASKRNKFVLVLSQKNPDVEQPTAADLYPMGVVGQVVRTLKLNDGRYKVLLQGIVRAKAISFNDQGEYLTAKLTPLFPTGRTKLNAEDEAVVKRIRENMQILVEQEHLPEEMLVVTEDLRDPGVLADVILAHYKLEPEQGQQILEELDGLKRLRITDSIIADDMNRLQVSERIKDQARSELTKGQREYYLREQIKQIQRELGEEQGSLDDLSSLRLSLEKAKLPEYARVEAMKQYSRLERMHAESSEYALLRTYLEWIADLPWSVATEDCLELKNAKKILDRDHFGLDKAKDRILEYLAVRKLNKDSKGPILCFVGPPGVGKTSLGRSISQALGRKFFRMSLGGVRDEAEIRGHRRTYVGALPGRIVQGLKQTESRNPVFVLDELDKVGTDFREDPASALLEVLDPAQNKDFRDHYLNLPFDLSEVLFVATANTLDTIPEALLDRLEVIYISGYTTQEKLNIAKKFLVPRQLKENGIAKHKPHIDDKALLYLIERYTQEAGVRNLEREIGSLFRKVAREFAARNKIVKTIDQKTISKLLGPTKFDPELAEAKDVIGLVRGLAWTIYGGEMMQIEASLARGKGGLTLTGQLGSVMQESAQAAMFFARANAEGLGLDPTFSENYDIHIHVPAGATPKDGPSAGITIATALISALSNRKVSKDVAMTGEMTLRGNVLPIGGLKEKALAALRDGIKKVIIPAENMKDIEEIPKEQREKIKFIPVKHINEVIETALLRKEKVATKSTPSRKGTSRIVKPALAADL